MRSELLADHREDEVGVARRQERQLLLGALHEALAEEAARADRDLGLRHVITLAQLVEVGD